mgnify:CR=1 FL=1|tara:strand:- start:283 stop:1047 length:765 start_codon:yes stop_codon:yes gene_type:complete
MKANYKTPARLLSAGISNAKTKKNELKTFILYLAPYKQNFKGVNICPKASKGCAAACLFTAGRGAFNNVQNARINKTNFYIENKPLFVKKLATEIIRETAKAKKKGEKIAFRLNGTSDIDFIYLLEKYAGLNVIDLMPTAILYDYTKILGKIKKYIQHPNYYLTFSRAEDNETETIQALQMGANVSAVFSHKLPTQYKGFKVIDGDTSDLVMINHSGVILGLRAKGKARKDNSGFTIDTSKLKTKQNEQIKATV